VLRVNTLKDANLDLMQGENPRAWPYIGLSFFLRNEFMLFVVEAIPRSAVEAMVCKCAIAE
jgi:hypothetical protein